VSAIAFDHVEKTYRGGVLRRDGIVAVRDVSLTIPVGSVFVLLSLSRPTAGNVSRFGEPAKNRQTLGRVGYMHENHAFPRYLSASEVLHFYGGLSGVPSEDLDRRAEILLERVGLADRKREPISRFSKGMVQRLGLAQALMNEPDLLILDEPTEGLDLLGRQLMREVVREFKQSGRTVLLVSHVLTEVDELCDDLAVIVAGEIVFRGKPPELTKNGHLTLEAALKDLYLKGAK
jgi:ABC-2 type transport system ATP-binding protein